jgi:hypothetical protein
MQRLQIVSKNAVFQRRKSPDFGLATPPPGVRKIDFT